MNSRIALVLLLVAAATSCAKPFKEPKLSQRVRERPDLEERLADPSRTIAGQVVDGEGRPIQAQVLIVSGEESSSMDTGSDGQFRLVPPGAGELALHAQTEDGRVGVLREPRLGRLDHRITVRLGATLSVDHDAAGPARLSLFHDNRRIVDTPVVIGREDTWVVPAGTVRVVLYDDTDRSAERRLTVAAGDDVDVQLSLRPAATAREASSTQR